MEQAVWLILSYQVPTEPSKARVYVWRKLKDLGAIYFRQGVAMLPRSQRNLNSFAALGEKIESMSGEASIAEIKFLNKHDDQKAISEFVSQSRNEYKKLISEIASVYSRKPSSKEEAVLLEEKAKKLEKKLKKIMSRDFFMSHKEPEVVTNLNQLLKDMREVKSNLPKYLYMLINEA